MSQYIPSDQLTYMDKTVPWCTMDELWVWIIKASAEEILRSK